MEITCSWQMEEEAINHSWVGEGYSYVMIEYSHECYFLIVCPLGHFELKYVCYVHPPKICFLLMLLPIFPKIISSNHQCKTKAASRIKSMLVGYCPKYGATKNPRIDSQVAICEQNSSDNILRVSC